MNNGYSLNAILETASQYENDKTDFYASPRSTTDEQGQARHDTAYVPRFRNGQMEFRSYREVALGQPVIGETIVGEFGVNDHCWQQMDQKLGPIVYGKGNSQKSLPTDFLQASMKLFPEETSALMNRALEKYPGSLVRTYNGTARAFLSSRYGQVDNLYLLEKAQEAFALMGRMPRITRVELTPDRLFIMCEFIDLDPHDEFAQAHDGQKPYSMFVVIRNDEVGGGKLETLGGFKRHTCDNSAIYNHEGSFSVMHIGRPVILADRFAQAISQELKFSEELLVRFLNAKQVEIPDIAGAVRQLGEINKWDVEMVASIMQGTEGQNNLYGFSNGLSWAAQKLEGDKRFEMEKMSGAILVEPESLFGRVGSQSQMSWINQIPKLDL